MPFLGHLLRLVTWPHWTKHGVRTLLTVMGIALGVGSIIGIADVSRSVLVSFERALETVAGSSELEVTSPSGSVDEALIERVARTEGVKTAAGLVEAFLPLADRSDESLYVFGVDFLGSNIWEAQLPRKAIDLADELVFLAQTDSVVVTRNFATRAGFQPGGEIRVVAPDGARSLRVRGLLDDSPAARLFDGSIAVMDLPAAQRLFGRERRVDRIAVQLARGIDVEDMRARLSLALGPSVAVETAEARGEQAEKLLVSLRTILVGASSLAVIVGAFIVYHTVAVSVQQRRREFALLNALGVGAHTLIRLCLLETILLGVVGILAGITGGELLARAAAGLVGDTASDIWLRLTVTGHARSSPGILAALIVGSATAIASAYLAVRASTVEALRPATVEVEDVRVSVRAVTVGLLLLSMTWLVLLVPCGIGFVPLVAIVVGTQAIGYAGGALLAPSLVAVVGRSARRLLRRSAWLGVRLAAENLPRTPLRTGSTVATIAAALGMAVTMTGLVESFQTAWVNWIDHHFSADLFIGGGSRFRLLAGPPMSERLQREIAGTPGVLTVEPFRVLQVRLGDRPVFLQSLSVEHRLQRDGLAMVEGDLARAALALRRGTGVLLSDNLASRLGLHASDTVELPTPNGSRQFRVEGTFIDYLGSLDLGAVAVEREQLATIWGDRSANLFRVWIEPHASPSTVRAAVLERLGPGYYALTTQQFLEGVRAVLARFFLATWALVFVAAVVGVIGVVNAQLATVLDRSTEIAMVRTIGLTTGQITRAVILECAAIGGIGSILGVAVGGMLGAQLVLVLLHVATGWRMPFHLPLGPVLGSVVVATLVSAAAGYLPARTAARIEASESGKDREGLNAGR